LLFELAPLLTPTPGCWLFWISVLGEGVVVLDGPLGAELGAALGGLVVAPPP
jgi:hypothetical protein